MELIIDEKTESGTLILTGELTVNQVAFARDHIAGALKKVKVLTADLGQATEADLSFLQLLCSAHRTAATLNKTFKLTKDSPAALQKAINDNGYRRNSGCVLDSTTTCLWVLRNHE
jgi:ABC-type transporter Mla MlaB component